MSYRADAQADRPGGPLRVGLLGFGAIGRPVAEALTSGAVPGATLTGIVTTAGPVVGAFASTAALAAGVDLVVEAASQAVVATHAADVVAAGADLLVVSVGALADPALRARLDRAGPGRVWTCPGAIGGIDLLRALRRAGPVRVQLISTKAPAALLQAWMDDGQRVRLAAIGEGEELVVFVGPAGEAACRFPANANVAATLALAAGDWDAVDVTMVARGGASGTHHRILIDAAVGAYELSLRNRTAPDNPRTSALVAPAVLRCIEDRVGLARPLFA
jgi:aspartate dehydrogenase